MKTNRLIGLNILFLCGCMTTTVPDGFAYTEIKTDTFTLASWQKKTSPAGLYKIYIEGDGHAFNARGLATSDPTPKGTFVRELAFGDKNPNVIYLARPCQYVKNAACDKKYWTTARFAPEVVASTYQAIKRTAGNNPVILVGFSGGAQIAGLTAVTGQGLNVKKIVTIAGNLDHSAWTALHRLPPLFESMNLAGYRERFAMFPQIHYAGEKDTNITPFLIRRFVKDEHPLVIVPEATHDKNWNGVFQAVQAEN